MIVNDGTVDSSADTVAVTAATFALYPNNGAKWNDYVKNNGSDIFSANGTACDADTDGPGYNACIHGGEMRAVEVAGKSICTNLTATDDLEVFDWVCDANTSPVRMVSTGFKEGKGLSDLIDFSGTPAWRTNFVTVKDNGVDYLTTDASIWWSNPIVVNNDGGTLDSSSTVYVVTTNGPVAAEYKISNSSVNKVALVIKPDTTLSGPGTNTTVIDIIASTKFHWIEGTIDATDDSTGVSFTNTKFSVIRNLKVANASSFGIMLSSSSNNKLVDITAANNNDGVYLGSSSNNILKNVTAFNNGNYGIWFNSVVKNNTMVNVTAFNNNKEIYLADASDNILVNVTTANNFGDGIHLFSGSDNNVVVNLSAANNYASGIYLDTSNKNTFENMSSADNYAVSGFNGPVRLKDSSYNYFTGVIKTGKTDFFDCYIVDGTDPGLWQNAGVCINNGSSDAAITNSITLASSFEGKVSSDDTVNQDDVAGTLDYDSITDWTHFQYIFRGWGSDGSAFPNTDNMDQCPGDCRIWDWSLDDNESLIRNVYTTPPTGNDIITHVWEAADATACSNIPGAAWGGNVCSLTGYTSQIDCEAAGGDWTSDKCSSVFLRNTVEIMCDGIGNENGLCESNETCLFTPNIGSYQGHGVLISAGTFTDGTLTDITLKKYETNGR